jgi:hypothetical protein
VSSSGAVTATTITLSDATAPVVIAGNAKVCLDGATCSKWLRYNTSTGQIDLNGILNVATSITTAGAISTSAYFSAVTVGAIPTCAAGTLNRLYVFSGTPARLCICTDRGGGAYRWVNLLVPTDSSGNATTCPSTP